MKVYDVAEKMMVEHHRRFEYEHLVLKATKQRDEDCLATLGKTRGSAVLTA